MRRMKTKRKAHKLRKSGVMKTTKPRAKQLAPKTKSKSKTAPKLKIKMRKGSAVTHKTKVAKARITEGDIAKPVSIASGRKREPGGDSDRGFYLRLGDEANGPANKAKVKAAADKLGIPMNKFAAAATMRFVDSGLNPVTHSVPKDAPEDPASAEDAQAASA